MAKIAEAGLAAEPVQFAVEGPVLTQTSSRTNVEHEATKSEGHDGDLTRLPTGEGGEVAKTTSADPENGLTAPGPAANEATLMSGPKLYLVFVAMMLGVFMFALDQSVSIPPGNTFSSAIFRAMP